MSAPQTPSTVQFIQAQPFTLAGAGTSIGDTTILLNSMYGIDGVTTIVTADLGSYAFATLEPGNGTQEEAILFTGVTQNANGTATLTGVSSIGFKQPYTVTTGLTKTHAGASKLVLSNDAAFYNNFTLYMNSIAGAGAANASTAVKGLVQAATAAQINSATATGSTGAILVVTPDALSSSTYNLGNYSVGAGTTSAYTAPLALTSLASGQVINLLVPATNAASVTLNINGLGAKTIKKSFSSALASGEVVTGQVAQMVYDGTAFQLINASKLSPILNTYATGATWTRPVGLNYVVAEVVGGGGGGSAGVSTTLGGGGGGGGGYSKRTILASTLATSIVVSVGGGGASTVAGGTSSFGSLCSATGGTAGSTSAGVLGGIGSSGDVNAAGGAGGTGGATTPSGQGGSSVYGGGGNAVTGNGNTGVAGQAYGGGGGGGFGSGGAGGAGAAGVVFVTEYYN